MKHFTAWFYTHPALRDTEQYTQKSVCGTAATGTGQTRPARRHQPAFALPGVPQRKAGDHLALSSARTTPDECFLLNPPDKPCKKVLTQGPGGALPNCEKSVDTLGI